MLDELDQKLKEFEDLHKEKKRQIKAEFQEDPVVPGPQLIELDSESDDAIAQEAVGNQQAEEAEEDGQPAQEAQALAPAPALPQRPLYVSDKPFKCHVSHCGKGYKTKKRLSKHATSKHNKQGRSVCFWAISQPLMQNSQCTFAISRAARKPTGEREIWTSTKEKHTGKRNRN